MGWNSYPAYGAAVTEADVRANADYMAEHLLSYGWQYVVIDYAWYYPHPPGSTEPFPQQFRSPSDQAPVPWLGMDEYGRLLPDLRKFPSSQGAAGFRPLADELHSRGLKFGIHMLRGIPRQAVWARSPIFGAANIDASMIADTTSTGFGSSFMWGVDMSQPGAQAYYNSLFELYASWEVDYVLLDDGGMGDTDPGYAAEIAAVRQAITQSGRDIVLQLASRLPEAQGGRTDAGNPYPTLKDNWSYLATQFTNLPTGVLTAEAGNWPAIGPMYLGRLSRRGPSSSARQSRLTTDEVITHLTLWAISGSPLFYGGDLPSGNEWEHRLITNEEVLAVNQAGRRFRQLFRKGDQIVWVAETPDVDELYVALFNVSDEETIEVEADLRELGFKGKNDVRELWTKEVSQTRNGRLRRHLPPHGAALYRVSKAR